MYIYERFVLLGHFSMCTQCVTIGQCDKHILALSHHFFVLETPQVLPFSSSQTCSNWPTAAPLALAPPACVLHLLTGCPRPLPPPASGNHQCTLRLWRPAFPASSFERVSLPWRISLHSVLQVEVLTTVHQNNQVFKLLV